MCLRLVLMKNVTKFFSVQVNLVARFRIYDEACLPRSYRFIPLFTVSLFIIRFQYFGNTLVTHSALEQFVLKK